MHVVSAFYALALVACVSTGIASSNDSRNYLGIDKDIGYCNKGVKCGQPCDADAECTPPVGGQCWKEVTCGHCNYLSHYKCGQVCGVDGDCSPGSCWGSISTHECDDILKYYCDAESGSKCGEECETESDSDCLSGHCVTYQSYCGNSSTPAGYCSLESANCGSACSKNSECSDGFCVSSKEECSSTITVGTYTGALPDGIPAPSLNSIPDDVNLIMLSFAKDATHTGHFEPFNAWAQQGITKTNIEQDKAKHPDRKYLISLGGTTGVGGDFGIAANMTVDQWVTNSIKSVETLIKKLSADGAEMQFEGNTADARFVSAMTGLLSGLKGRGFLTAMGPYYGPLGTWNDYKPIKTELVDFVNMQFYSVQDNSVDHTSYFVQAVQQELGPDRKKLVAGFNSNKSLPKPPVALKTVYKLCSSLQGVFTWDIEHSRYNHPPYCLETQLAGILKHGYNPDVCVWN